MAALLCGILGSTLAMLLLCYGVYRVGPKKLQISLALQALISGFLTLYISSDHDGTQYRQIDVAISWAGWALALSIMVFVLLKKMLAIAPIHKFCALGPTHPSTRTGLQRASPASSQPVTLTVRC